MKKGKKNTGTIHTQREIIFRQVSMLLEELQVTSVDFDDVNARSLLFHHFEIPLKNHQSVKTSPLLIRFGDDYPNKPITTFYLLEQISKYKKKVRQKDLWIAYAINETDLKCFGLNTKKARAETDALINLLDLIKHTVEKEIRADKR